jgi:hypothetical protein
MAMLQTCFTEGCAIKTLGKFCLDCETASGITEPAATQLTLTSAVARDLTPAV